MAPPAPPVMNDADKAKLLKTRMAEATKASHKAKKDPKEKAREKAEAETKAKELKVKKAEQAAAAKFAASFPTPAKATTPAAPPPPPSPFAVAGQPEQEIGIHIGISCDGCNMHPPLIGRAMKCRQCVDFDLCERCYPERLDKGREAVAAAAGMPGKGRHPANHHFGARRATHIMTRAAADIEIAATAAERANSEAQDAAMAARAQARRDREAQEEADSDPLLEHVGGAAEVRSLPSLSPEAANTGAAAGLWTTCAFWAKELVVPRGLPRSFGPDTPFLVH